MKKTIAFLSVAALLAGPLANISFADELEFSKMSTTSTEEVSQYALAQNDVAANDGYGYYNSPAYGSGTATGVNWVKWGLLLGAIGGGVAIIVNHNNNSGTSSGSSH